MRRRSKRLPRQAPLQTHVLAYYSALRQITDWCATYVKEHLVPVAIDLSGKERADADPVPFHGKPIPHKLAAILADAETAFHAHFPEWKLQKILNQILGRVSKSQKKQLAKQFKSALGIDLGLVVDKGLTEHVRKYTDANVALIKSIPTQFFGQVHDVISEGVRKGKRAEAIQQDLQDRVGVAKSRAALIARDQVAKFHQGLNRIRQKNLGVEQFVWRGMNDERERPGHSDREGEVYSWAEGVPDDVLADDDEDGAHFPGDAVSCRCGGDPFLGGDPDD